MIVCSCNFISRSDIEDVIASFLEADAWRLITPGMVYHAMEKRGKCCNCFPGVVEIIVTQTQKHHDQLATPPAQVVSLVERLRAEQRRHDETRRALAIVRSGRAA